MLIASQPGFAEGCVDLRLGVGGLGLASGCTLDQLHLVAIRIAQRNEFAAAGQVQFRDGRSAQLRNRLVELRPVIHFKGHADEGVPVTAGGDIGKGVATPRAHHQPVQVLCPEPHVVQALQSHDFPPVGIASSLIATRDESGK